MGNWEEQKDEKLICVLQENKKDGLVDGLVDGLEV